MNSFLDAQQILLWSKSFVGSDFWALIEIRSATLVSFYSSRVRTVPVRRLLLLWCVAALLEEFCTTTLEDQHGTFGFPLLASRERFTTVPVGSISNVLNVQQFCTVDCRKVWVPNATRREREIVEGFAWRHSTDGVYEIAGSKTSTC
ncbi:hypothetical protein K470DRAFT_23053 [Piedraia hortae CBS 480.64]|uniref:Uncharacterized protein n=1 Tax=Piedraia hortae CBS 480.64 TaxID=1314780 RepID=A0A6A7C4B3_9PEZI|nr:hypothetical protein K470DRAFT_23053 [Piedraia hortae CBS 480.64]